MINDQAITEGPLQKATFTAGWSSKRPNSNHMHIRDFNYDPSFCNTQ